MKTIERELEALRLLIPPLRSREDLLRFKAEIAALRLAAKNGTSTDTPSLNAFNENSARRKSIHSSIQDKAAAQPELFKSFVRGLKIDSIDEAFKYADLIESIAKKCAEWKHFLLEELDRVLLFCERSESPSPFFALKGFAFLESCRDSEITEAIRQRYVLALRSTSPLVRRATIDLADGYMISGHADLRSAVSECLSDPDWRVRARSEALLVDQQLLPLGYRPSVIDRVRRRLFTWRI